MQCPHQEEKNWTSQAEDELVTVGLRLPLLRISSGSSSVYRRAAARAHPGTTHRTSAAWKHERIIIPADQGEGWGWEKIVEEPETVFVIFLFSFLC